MKKQETRINQAFNAILDNPSEQYYPFGISASWLAKESGVSKKIISEFRNEKTSVQTDTFEKLLLALPTEARTHLLSKLASEEVSSYSVLSDLEPQQFAGFLEAKIDLLIVAIPYLSPMSRAVIMNAIAQCLRTEAKGEKVEKQTVLAG